MNVENNEFETLNVESQQKTGEQIVSYPKLVLWFLKQILFVSGSFDFSWALVFLTILIGHLQISNNEANSSDEDLLNLTSSSSDIVNPLAVAPLTLTLFEMTIITFMSVYFGYSQELSPKFRQLATSVNPEDDAMLNDMSSLYKSGLIISFPLMAAVILPSVFFEKILIVLGQDPTVSAAAQRFSRVLAISVCPILIRFLMEQFIMSANKFKVPMLIAIPNLIIGIGLGSVLTFGPPKWGLEGIGLGFAVSAFLNGIVFTVYAKQFMPFSKIPFYSQWNKSSIRIQLPKILKNGFPFIIQWFGELSAGFALSIFAGQLGTNSLASWNSAQGLIFLTNLFRIASGITALNRFGAENTHSPENASREVRASIITSYILVAPFCIATFVEPKLILWLFSNTASSEVEKMTGDLLRIVSTGILGNTPNMIFMFVPKFKGDLWIPHVITITSVWAGAGIGWALANNTTLDVNGLGIGFTSGALISTIANGIRMFRAMKPSTTTDIQTTTTHSTKPTCFQKFFNVCCTKKVTGEEEPSEKNPLLKVINN